MPGRRQRGHRPSTTEIPANAHHLVSGRKSAGLDARRPLPARPHDQPLDGLDDQVGGWHRRAAGLLRAKPLAKQLSPRGGVQVAPAGQVAPDGGEMISGRRGDGYLHIRPANQSSKFPNSANPRLWLIAGLKSPQTENVNLERTISKMPKSYRTALQPRRTQWMLPSQSREPAEIRVG